MNDRALKEIEPGIFEGVLVIPGVPNANNMVYSDAAADAIYEGVRDRIANNQCFVFRAYDPKPKLSDVVARGVGLDRRSEDLGIMLRVTPIDPSIVDACRRGLVGFNMCCRGEPGDDKVIRNVAFDHVSISPVDQLIPPENADEPQSQLQPVPPAQGAGDRPDHQEAPEGELPGVRPLAPLTRTEIESVRALHSTLKLDEAASAYVVRVCDAALRADEWMNHFSEERHKVMCAEAAMRRRPDITPQQADKVFDLLVCVNAEGSRPMPEWARDVASALRDAGLFERHGGPDAYPYEVDELKNHFSYATHKPMPTPTELTALVRWARECAQPCDEQVKNAIFKLERHLEIEDEG